GLASARSGKGSARPRRMPLIGPSAVPLRRCRRRRYTVTYRSPAVGDALVASTRAQSRFSPADICQWFEIPRTTLFRWEDTGLIPRTHRGLRGERVYDRRHLHAIAAIVRQKTREEISNSIR